MQSLTLPLPPSLNRYYRNVNGRTLISSDGRKYKAGVRHYVVEQQIESIQSDRIWLHMLIERADKRRADVDNMAKCCLDSLQADDDWPGCYSNDGQIDLLVLERGKQSTCPRVIVSFGQIGELTSGRVLDAVRGSVRSELRLVA